MRKVLLSAVLTLAFSPGAWAQQPLPPLLPVDCQELVDLLSVPRTPADRELVARQLVAMNLHAGCLAQALVADEKQNAGFPAFLKALEAFRTDKQSGSSVGTGGSTNLVSKGATAKVLALAAEYGALTESVNKAIVTVQGSLDGVPAVLVRRKVVPYCPSGGTPGCVNSTLIETLQRFSYAVSFDTSQAAQSATGTASGASQGNAQPVTFAAEGHSVTAVTGRVVLWNARDKVSKAFQSAWLEQIKKNPKALDQAAGDLMTATGDLVGKVTKDANYKGWQDETVRQLTAASPDQAAKVWAERLHALAETLRPDHADIFDAARQQLGALSAYRFEEDAIVAVLQKPIATLQYDYKRPTNQPATSTVRLVFDKGIAPDWSLTANGAVELYDQKPSDSIPGSGRVRDVQVGVQLQWNLGTLQVLGAAALAGTYYFQHQSSPAILNVTPATPLSGISLVGLPSTATQVFATKGNIHVAQVRLVLGPQNSSARFPVSISYSNRTELIAKRAWRAQIGVSYDFDALFGK